MPDYRLDTREETFCIDGPRRGMKLFLRKLARSQTSAAPAGIVLYIHGATFPSALSIAYRFAEGSWRDRLCDAGFDVWAFDFYGYGASDRYPEQSQPAQANAPLGTAQGAAEQIATAVAHILRHEHAERLSLIAHSWGTMAASLFAGDHPEQVERLVLFGPIARREPREVRASPSLPAWKVVSLHDQWARFIEDVPPDVEPVLSRTEFEAWGQAYLDSDPGSRSRDPAAVNVPFGPSSEVAAAWQGRFPYDPARVEAPVAIIRGEWDGLTTDADARWLFDAFSRSPEKRDVKISRGTHLLHLEAMRGALWRESIAFLKP